MFFTQMDELSNLRLFTRVVEEGSFSAAARFFGVTPSSVSRQIAHLEQELGTRLFNRTTRKQSLTEAGEIYFQHASRIARDLDEAGQAVSRLTDTPSGSLHVTAEADFAVAFIAPFLPDFLSLYPDMRLRLSMSAGNLDLVESGLDLAIRIGQLEDSTLIARKIAESRSVICASPAYLAEHGTPSHPKELEAHSCLSFRIAPGKNQWSFTSRQGGPIDVPISGPLNTNSLVFLKESALAALGVIMIPSWMVGDALECGDLVPLLEGFPLRPPSTPVSAVFAHNRHLAPKVRAFVDFCAERLSTGYPSAVSS